MNRLNRTTPEEIDPMTQAEPDRTIPGWTYDELSALFWHHHYQVLAASGMCVVLALLGAVLFVAESEYWAMVVPVEVIAGGIAVWHRAHASLLTKLRFPGGRVR